MLKYLFFGIVLFYFIGFFSDFFNENQNEYLKNRDLIKSSKKEIFNENRQQALDKENNFKKNKNKNDFSPEFLENNPHCSELYGCQDVKVENSINKPETITSVLKLIDRFTDPGYVSSSFRQNELFWVSIKSPPPNADLYAQMVCEIAKSEYELKGFVVTIRGFDNKEYGKFGCY